MPWMRWPIVPGMEAEKTRAIYCRTGQRRQAGAQAAARLAARLPEASWKKLNATSGKRRRKPAIGRASRRVALSANGDSGGRDRCRPGLYLVHRETNCASKAVRLLMLALGDYYLKNPPIEGYTPTRAAFLKGRETIVQRILQAVRPLFPSGHELLDSKRRCTGHAGR